MLDLSDIISGAESAPLDDQELDFVPQAAPEAMPVVQAASPHSRSQPSQQTQRKRQRVSYSSDSDTETSIKRRRHSSPSTKSHTYQKQLKRRAHTDASFRTDPRKLAAFRQKIVGMDSHAEFDPKDPCTIRCSSCAVWVQMRLLYDVLHFANHRRGKRCLARQATGLAKPSLLTFFQRGAPSLKAPRSLPPLHNVACPGLSRDIYPLINKYLYRSASEGGGAPTRARIIAELCRRGTLPPTASSWTYLKKEEQKMVIRQEEQTWKWVNSRAIGAIFSTACERDVPHRSGDKPNPCGACLSVLRLHTFQVQLNRPVPDESNMRYVPKAHRGSEDLQQIYLRCKGVREIVELVRENIVLRTS
jgi:hypothetical protein